MTEALRQDRPAIEDDPSIAKPKRQILNTGRLIF